MQPTEPWTATRLNLIVLLYLYLNFNSQRDQLLHCLKKDLLAWYTTVMSFMLQIYRYVDISKKKLKDWINIFQPSQAEQEIEFGTVNEILSVSSSQLSPNDFELVASEGVKSKNIKVGTFFLLKASE